VTVVRRALDFFLAVRPVAVVVATTLDWLDTLRGRRDPLIPPRRLMFVGRGDFRSAGREFRNHFVRLADLRPDEDVLDIGSGVGRIAVGLVGWLNGRYEGVEVVRQGVEWCQHTITPRYPNFHFQVADVYNRHYNRHGHTRASDYRFPFEDASFDFVFLTSVFTHLLPADRDNYIAEIARLLRPTGRCFATFFLLNDTLRERQPTSSSLNFRFERPGYWTIHRRKPEAAVGYDENDVIDTFERNGLHVTGVHHGEWSGNEASPASYQDIIVVAPNQTQPHT
jgi:SAM-dependent methyltransferase